MPARVRYDSPRVLFGVALVLGLAALWPPLHLIVVRANLATYFHENIGYHFFWVLRLVDGAPGDFVHPGQGVLLSLLQAVYYLIGKLAGLDLYGQIDLFGMLTLGVACAAMLGLMLAMALDRRLDIGLRAALVTSPLAMGLGHAHVFAYGLYPDYHAYTKVFFLLFAWLWLRRRGWEGIESPRVAAGLGVLTGLLGALKVNYVVFPAGLVLMSFALAAKGKRTPAARAGFVYVAVAAAVVSGLFILHYGLRPAEVGRFFTLLWHFGRELQGSSGLTLDPFASWSINSTSNLSWLVALLVVPCLLGLASRRGRAAVFSLVLLGLGGLAVAMCYWRGGGAGYFDAVVIVTVLSVIATATLGSDRMTRVTSLGLAAVFVLWPAAWLATHWHKYAWDDGGLLPRLAEAGDWQRGLFEWNVKHELPIYVLMPSNGLTEGTIEDMMLRGMTNFTDSWYLANQNPTRAALFPAFHIGNTDLALPNRRVVFMWVTSDRPIYMRGAGEPPALMADRAMLDRVNQSVERILRGRRREACYQVRHIMTNADIVSCVVSAPDGAS